MLKRAIQEVGNLLEGETVVLLQDDGGPLIVWKHGHRLGHRPAELAPGHEILDRFGRLRLRRELDEIDALGRLRNRRPPFAADPVAAQIQRDAVEPRRELRLAFEPAEGAERSEKGFLGDVARVFFAADDPVRERVNGPLPAQHELVETVEIAAA